MKTIRTIATILIFITSTVANGQNLNKTFHGSWATTSWTFEFHSDGTYKRISSGHFGNSTVNGEYETKSDTIHMLTGFEKTSGTVNEYYILDKDSMLIDLDLRYDYAPMSKSGTNFYNSKIRQIKYPQIQTDKQNTKTELENFLNLAFNSPTAKKYYHFDNLPQRRLLIADYFNLKAKIQVDTNTAIFKPIEQIKENFFIEFVDINQSRDRVQIKIKIHGEGVSIWFYFIKVNGQWKEQEPHVIEN